MALTSGASHGISAFVTLVVGTMLSKYVWDLMPPLGELSLLVIDTVRSTTGIAVPASREFAGMLVVMVGLSSAWGIAYHLGRHS